MRISLSWIARLLGRERLEIADDELVRRLTLHLAEIDAVERTGPELAGVVVGRVLTCGPHPDADRLRVTTVDIGGDEALPIVCGAPNVAAGQHVAVATVGTVLTVPGKDGTPTSLTIKKGKLRGEPSHGMICAEDELGLGDSHDGILVLAGEPAPGTPLASVLPGGDTVLVVDNHNINHRPDLWGHLGWAREIAAILGLEAPAAPDIAWRDGGAGVALRIEDQRCTCYRGAVLRGVDNRQSPVWMRQLLEAAGVRPLGLLVDVTNYVMLELGEPMHAFDRREIRGDAIAVRPAAAGEVLVTLDDQRRELVAEDLVIADGERVLALAGIMGGEASGVRDDTSEIVLEAATFHPASIRRSRIRHGLATESSSRFEKGLYPELTAAAINRAIDLLQECCPGAEVVARFQAGAGEQAVRHVVHDPAAVERYVGIAIPEIEQRERLHALGFVGEAAGMRVPWWRAKDVEEPTDLVEEVARLHGYHHVAPEVPRLPARTPEPNPLRRAEHRCRRLLSGLGWDEVQTYGFTSRAWADGLGWPAELRIGLTHPLSSEQTVLRVSPVPTLAEAVVRNRRFLERVAIYEVGKVYARGIGRAPATDERLVVAGCVAESGADTPFYVARDAALELLAGLGHAVELRPGGEDAELQAGRCAELVVAGRVVGRVGELTVEARRLAGSEDRIATFVIRLEELLEQLGEPAPRAFVAPSRYQQVERDFTFVCAEQAAFGELASAAIRAGGALVRGVELAQPVYRGDPIPAGHKALSLRVLLQADDRTLSEKELRKVSDKIVRSIEHGTGASLRG